MLDSTRPPRVGTRKILSLWALALGLAPQALGQAPLDAPPADARSRPDAADKISRLGEQMMDAVAGNHVAPPARQQLLLAMLNRIGGEFTPERLRENAGLAGDAAPQETRAVLRAAVQRRLAGGADLEQVRTAMLASLNDVAGDVRWASAETLRVDRQLAENQYVGIGVSIGTADGLCVFHDVFARGPARKAGIVAGDRVLAVDGNDARKPLAEVVAMLRGPQGSQVTVKVAQPRQAPRDLTMVRDVVPIDTVEGVRRDEQDDWICDLPDVEGGLYLRVVNLAGSTAAEVRQLASRWPDGRGVLLDLRSSATGDVAHLRLLADALLPAEEIGQLQRATGTELLRTTEDHVFHGLPMVVLVDRGGSPQMHWLARALQRWRQNTEILGPLEREVVWLNEVVLLPSGDGLHMDVGLLRLPDDPPLRADQVLASRRSPQGLMAGGVAAGQPERNTPPAAAIKLLRQRLNQ